MMAAAEGNQRQLPPQIHTRTDEVMEETPDIVTFFIADRARAQGQVVPAEFSSVTVKGEIASCLRQVPKTFHQKFLYQALGHYHVDLDLSVSACALKHFLSNPVPNAYSTTPVEVGDDLDKNHSLNKLIGQINVTPQTAFDTFAEVATQIFSDGVYNWGRIVTLLYFGFKLASSVISQVPLLKLVVDWVVRFVKERLVNWIAQQGGWTAIKEYALVTAREATTTQLAGVALVGFAIFLMVLGRK